MRICGVSPFHTFRLRHPPLSYNFILVPSIFIPSTERLKHEDRRYDDGFVW